MNAVPKDIVSQDSEYKVIEIFNDDGPTLQQVMEDLLKLVLG